MARMMGYKKPKDLKKTIFQLLAYMKNHKFAFFLIAVLVILSTSANLMGTYLVKPVINHVTNNDYEAFFELIVFMGCMYGVGVICTYAYTQLMVKIAQKMVSEMRQDLFNKTQQLPLVFFDVHTHGELMSRFTNDIDTVSEALNNSFTMLIQSFMMISGTITMIVILNVRLSIVVLFSMVCMTLFIRYSGKKSKHYFANQQKYLGNLNGFIEEMVEGAKVVKVFNHESANLEEFSARNQRLQDASTDALTYSGIMVPVVVSISYLNYAISACIGGLFAISGLMDLGSLAAYLIYVRQTAMPINQFTQQMNLILAALSGAERIFEVMGEAEEIDKGNVTLCHVRKENDQLIEVSEEGDLWAWKHPRMDGSVKLVELKGDVRFHDVVFAYESNHTVLNDVSLFAKPGQKIAFVGSTGAGKTTITNLINRFYELSSGSITYDGIDIRLIKKDDLRRSLSMVLQDTHLFSGTIADNIRYGKLEASDEEVIQAAKLANAHSFIRRLPQGYQTLLSSDGANLSQGQRQLLAISRAAVANPPVLILDEATSSIDTRTEKLIERGMDRLMENRTVFVIAHRLSTIRNAQAIMVLEHGVIIERGSHEELLAKKERYYQLYTGQFELS